MCQHRKCELVAWVLAVSTGVAEFADPLPPRKPPASETLAAGASGRKAASL